MPEAQIGVEGHSLLVALAGAAPVPIEFEPGIGQCDVRLGQRRILGDRGLGGVLDQRRRFSRSSAVVLHEHVARDRLARQRVAGRGYRLFEESTRFLIWLRSARCSRYRPRMYSSCAASSA